MYRIKRGRLRTLTVIATILIVVVGEESVTDEEEIGGGKKSAVLKLHKTMLDVFIAK